MRSHQSFALQSPVTASDHVIGSEDAQVTLVEYADFQCPYCKQAAPALKLLRSRFPGKLRVVFRHFPLEEVHPHALRAAQAAECAAAQGKFWEMHDLLYENQQRLSEEHVLGYARQLQLDMHRYVSELSSGVYVERIRAHRLDGMHSGAHGTPTFFINSRLTDASFGLQSLSEAISRELRAHALGLQR